MFHVLPIKWNDRITLWMLFLVAMIVSCSRDGDLQASLDAAQNRLVNREYDAVQAELLRAEALITHDTPLSQKEYLERLKGMNYLELRVMDKAKVS